MRLPLKNSKHTWFKAHRQSGLRGVRSPIWRISTYHNTTIYMAERFRNFYIDHGPHQQNVHIDALSPHAASLALPAGVTEKVLVYSYDLYCPNFALEDNQTLTGGLQVKESLETSAGQSSKIGDSHISTTSYMAYCLMILKRRLSSEGRPLDSTTMRYHEHCIADRMMESSSATYHIKRHMRHSKRLMMACADLTNLVQSLVIDSEGSDITGRRWSLPSLMLKMPCLSDPWWFHSSGTRTFSSYGFFLAIWDVGEWIWSVLSGHLHPKGIGFSWI